MKWEKRNKDCESILDVVLSNTKKTKEEFFEKKEYYIQHLIDAVISIKCAIADNIPITVVGDYDVDGICAASIMDITLNEAGAKNVKIRLPKRFSEGYGLSQKIIDEIDSGLLITVDNGITAVDEIKSAKDKGLIVIVIDHHLKREDGLIPNADILIDPNAIENSATFNGYCGAGLAYKLSMEMLPKWSCKRSKLLSLATIATIADVMQLTDENRDIVKEGLETMVTKSGRTSGLCALLEMCGMDTVINEKNIAFKIAPILNAPGRIFDDGAMKSYELLSYDGPMNKAIEMAGELNNINEDRKKIKTEGLLKIEKNIRDNCLYGDSPLVIYESGLDEGLVGIYAGSLAEKYKVPCFVMTDSDNPDILKGSARTYGNVNIKELLDKSADILYKYGGHAEAAGLSVEKDKFEDMVVRFIESMPDTENEDMDTIYYDMEIESDGINKSIEELKKYAPFGNGNPEIVFMIKNFVLSPVGSGYYRTMGSDGQHIKMFGKTVSAVGFDMTKKYLDMKEPKIVNLIGTLSTNFFMGKTTNQIELIDFDAVRTARINTAFAKKLEQKAEERYR